MIQIVIYKNSKNEIQRVKLSGHAGYANRGKDVVCAAVSCLAITTFNSIEALTEDSFYIDEDESKGVMDFSLEEEPSKEAALLLQSFEIGVTDISESYGTDYVKITCKEV